MAQTLYRTADTVKWGQRFGNGGSGALTVSSNTTDAPTVTTFSG